MRERLARGLGWKPVVLALVALGLVVLALGAAGVGPDAGFRGLWTGSFGSARSIEVTLRETTPLLLAGVAVFLALRAGLFNIGAEGQLLVGALAAAGVALAVQGPGGLLMGALAGVAAGAAWAFPAGWIRAYRGGHEVISTIMLNNIARFFTGYLVAGPMQAAGQSSPSTGRLPEAALLPGWEVGGVEVSLAVGLAVMAVGLAWAAFRGTVWGYELRATGSGPDAALMAGIPVARMQVQAMLLSGGLAGLAGALQVLAYEGRFYDGFSPGYGFDALGVALLAGQSLWALLPAGLLFGALAAGTSYLSIGNVMEGIPGVPKGLGGVLLGLLILVAAAFRPQKEAGGA